MHLTSINIYKLKERDGWLQESDLEFSISKNFENYNIKMYVLMNNGDYGRIYKNDADFLGIEYKNERQIYSKRTGSIVDEDGDSSQFPKRIFDTFIVPPSEVDTNIVLRRCYIKGEDNSNTHFHCIYDEKEIRLELNDLQKDSYEFVKRLLQDIKEYEELNNKVYLKK